MSFDPLRACQLLARRLILEEEFSPLAAILPGMEDLSASVEASVARPVSGSVEVIAMATVEVGGRGPDDIEQLARDLRQRAESLAPRVKGRLIICLVLVTEQGLPTWLESVLKNLPEDTLTSKVRLGSAWCSLGGEARAFGHMEPPPGLNWYATSLADPNMPDRAQVERHLYEREREQRQLRAWLRPGPTWITFGLIASNVGYFFLHGNAVETFQKQGMSLAEASNAAYLMLGINNKLLVFDQGEYWRLLASTFLHGGQLHLAFNMMALYSLGGFFEKLAGPLRYLALYLVCGVLASLGSISANPAETY